MSRHTVSRNTVSRHVMSRHTMGIHAVKRLILPLMAVVFLLSGCGEGESPVSESCRGQISDLLSECVHHQAGSPGVRDGNKG